MPKLILLTLLVFSMSACQIKEDEQKNDKVKVDYGLFDNHLDSVEDIVEVEEDVYAVYYYDSTTEVSNEFLQFVYSYSKECDLPFYILESTNLTSGPVIELIKNKEVEERYIGEETMLDFFLQNDTDIIVLSSYEEKESIDEYLYGLYYYDSSLDSPLDIYETLYENYYSDIMTLYIFDCKGHKEELLQYDACLDESVYYIIKNQLVLKEYKGDTGLENYQKEKSNIDYDLFKNHTIYDVNQSLNVSEDLHYEYYYSNNCSHCVAIKEDLLYFFTLHPEMDLYLFELGSLNGDVLIDGFVGTPTLYVVDNNEVRNSYVGSLAIPTFLKEYNEGH